MGEDSCRCERVRNGLSLALLLTVPVLYLHYDWWIYGILPIVSGALALYAKPNCGTWRFLTSVAIVLGVCESAFLKWTFTSLADIPFNNKRGVYGIFHEGHLTSLVAFATILIIGVRLVNDEYHFTLAKLVRTLLLVSMFAGCAYVTLDSVRRGLASITV